MPAIPGNFEPKLPNRAAATPQRPILSTVGFFVCLNLAGLGPGGKLPKDINTGGDDGQEGKDGA